MPHPLTGPARQSVTVPVRRIDGDPRDDALPASPVHGRLADGTPYHAPLGRVLVDTEVGGSGERVCCHLCGHWFRSVTVHLRSHGWTLDGYHAAFGLEVTAVLEGRDTRDRRAAALERRLVLDPAVREGVRAGHLLARSGALAAYAAKAARGRRHPAERVAKTRAALAAVDPGHQAEANRRRAHAELVATADAALARLGTGLPLGSWVLEQVAAGSSLARASRQLGLDKDWLQRHLAALDPAAAASVQDRRLTPAEARLRDAVAAHGETVTAWLHRRHVDDGASVAAMARELGVARSVVQRALVRHAVRRPGGRPTVG